MDDGMTVWHAIGGHGSSEANNVTHPVEWECSDWELRRTRRATTAQGTEKVLNTGENLSTKHLTEQAQKRRKGRSKNLVGK